MVAKGVIVALVFLALADRGLSLSCRRCYEYFPTEDGQTVQVSICGPTPTCSHGLVKGVCGCCDVCAKGPGESCGGLWGLSGSCSAGYWCEAPGVRPANLPNEYHTRDIPGICVTHEVISTTPENETTTSVPTTTEFEITTNVITTKEIVTTFPWTCGQYSWLKC